MSKIILLIFPLFFYYEASSQTQLSEGAKLLFKNIKTKLTSSEKNQVYKTSGLVVSNDKKQFAIANDAVSLDHSFNAVVLPTDLNNDGKEELFVIYGNSYTSGETGSNVLLFIKDKMGNYQFNFGFSGTSPLILSTKKAGYPDLLIGGPGVEYPVWRWNGKEYIFYKKITEQTLSKIKTVKAEDISRAYINNVK
jgi:hypothetical protein